MKIKIYPPLAIHEMGTRGNQEDYIYPEHGTATEDDALFIVCDGMGGHEHGEVASLTFATALADYFKANATSDNVLADETLNKAIEHAYDCLDAKDSGSYKKMGTTLTLLYIHRGGVTAAHIGDSRIYHLRPGEKMLYISRDHSLVYDLYQSGEISFGEMKTSKQKNVITRAVQPGEDNRVKPDIIHITDIQPGDYFYMCSDGMLEQMEDDELFKLLSGKGSDNKKLRQLIASTSDNADNHSAYIIHIEAVTHEPSDNQIVGNEELTARCNALNIKVVKGDEPAANTEDDDATQLAPSVAKKPVRSPRRKKKTLTWLWWAILIAAIVAAAVWLTLYGLQDNHKQSNVPTRTELEESQTTGKPLLPSMIHRKAEPEKAIPSTRAPRPKKAQPQQQPQAQPQHAPATKSATEEAAPAPAANPEPSEDIKLPGVIKNRTAPSKTSSAGKKTVGAGNENDKPNRDK